MNGMPKPGEIYQHFKGNLYRIVTTAEHTETGEQLVVYQALYGDFQVYARPLSMFVSEVDHDKYPEVSAKCRFTLVPAVGGAPVAPVTEAPVSIPAPEAAAPRAEGIPAPAPMEQVSGHAEEPAPEAAVSGKTASLRETIVSPEEEFQLDPRLLAFLEADSYEKKLEIYDTLAGRVDASILNTIAVSLDLELSGETLEEQYDTLKNCLLMLERYECNRLR